MSAGEGEEKEGEMEEKDAVQNNESEEGVKNVETTGEGREKGTIYISRERRGGTEGRGRENRNSMMEI